MEEGGLFEMASGVLVVLFFSFILTIDCLLITWQSPSRRYSRFRRSSPYCRLFSLADHLFLINFFSRRPYPYLPTVSFSLPLFSPIVSLSSGIATHRQKITVTKKQSHTLGNLLSILLNGIGPAVSIK